MAEVTEDPAPVTEVAQVVCNVPDLQPQDPEFSPPQEYINDSPKEPPSPLLAAEHTAGNDLPEEHKVDLSSDPGDLPTQISIWSRSR